MSEIGENLRRELLRDALDGRALNLLVEFYDPLEANQRKDITSPDAARFAKLRVSKFCRTWNGLKYESWLTSGLNWKTTIGREFDSLNFELNNAGITEDHRGSRLMRRLSNIADWFTVPEISYHPAAQFVLDNQVEGMYVVLRLVSPRAGNDSYILYVGRCKRPGGIDAKTVKIESQSIVAGLDHEAPYRSRLPQCQVVDFAKGECLGNQTLAQKSPAYQEAASATGRGCDRRYETCVKFGNEPLFQGFRYVPITGSFRYIEVVDRGRFLGFLWRRKKKVTHTVQYSSVTDDSQDTPLTLAYGRVSILTSPLQWVDKGTTVDALQAICEGEIDGILKAEIVQQGLTLDSFTPHHGELGGVGTQQPDPRFPQSGYFSRTAYLGATYSGSADNQVDDVPETRVIIKARKVKQPDASGVFTKFEWTDNPAYVWRDFRTDEKLSAIPEWLIDDAQTIRTANRCDRVVIDDTGDNQLVIDQTNATLPVGYSPTGLKSPCSIQSDAGLYLGEPECDPYNHTPTIVPYDPINPPPSIAQTQFLADEFTCNVILTERVNHTDFVHKTLLPAFRGYETMGANGKLQLHLLDKACNAYSREQAEAGQNRLAVTDVSSWLTNRDGYLLIGVGTDTAEIGEVASVEWSTAGNGVTLSGYSAGGYTLALSGSTLTGGSAIKPASATVTVSGSYTVGSQVGLTLNGQAIVYSVHPLDDAQTISATLALYINAHPELSQQYYAAHLPATNTIKIQSLNGYLVLRKPLQNVHRVSEEHLCVAYVFENCQGLGFDNILQDSFSFLNEQQNSYNQARGTYTSAVEDFARVTIERTARRHVEYIGKTNAYDIDLSAVDNYRQAAGLTKHELITLRDCDVWFKWSSAAGAAFLRRAGEVVAVRHYAADNVVRYIPVRLRDVSGNDEFKVSFVGNLYLSAAYLPDVVPKPLTLPSTLQTDPNAGDNAPPAPTGGGGTVGVVTGGGGNTDYGNPYTPGGSGNYGYGGSYGDYSYYSPYGVDTI